jgi:hypothetical protein
MQVIIDDRERAITPFFDSHAHETIPHVVRRLEVGDYAIMKYNSLLAIIERKTWADLCSSLCDRRTNNMEKMYNARNQCAARLFYIVEGRRLDPETMIRNIPFKNLEAYLDHLAYEHSVFVIYSKDGPDSARRILALAKNISTIDEVRKIKAVTGTSEETLLKEKKVIDEIAVIESMLNAIPSVGSVMAAVMVKEGITFASLYEGKHTANELANLQYDTGAIFGAKGQKIINGMIRLKTDTEAQIKLMSTIPSISKATAAAILEHYSFADLCGDLAIEDLASLKIGEKKTKVGKNKSIYLLGFLCKEAMEKESDD